jgi:hypothetical protein
MAENKTVNLPAGAIAGKMTKTHSIGEIIEKTQKARKQNVYEVDFGMVSITGSLYGKIEDQEYDIILVPRAKK